MPTNPYFNHLTNASEQKFLNEFIVESIQMSGIDVYYIVRDYFELDPILKEPTKSVFERAYKIEVYHANVMGYDGDDMMSKYGFLSTHSAKWIISRSRFEELQIPGREHPEEGDLIFIGNEGRGSFTNELFMINQFIHDDPNWQLGRYNTYTVICEAFHYANDPINTGVPEIDIIEPDFSNVNELSETENAHIQLKKLNIVDFSEKNPFSGL